MKVCRACLSSKDVGEFYFKDAAKGIRHTICRSCFRVYYHSYYRSHRPRYSGHRRKNMAIYRERNKRFVLDFL